MVTSGGREKSQVAGDTVKSGWIWAVGQWLPGEVTSKPPSGGAQGRWWGSGTCVSGQGNRCAETCPSATPQAPIPSLGPFCCVLCPACLRPTSADPKPAFCVRPSLLPAGRAPQVLHRPLSSPQAQRPVGRFAQLGLVWATTSPQSLCVPVPASVWRITVLILELNFHGLCI